MSFLIPVYFLSVYHVALSGWKVKRPWHQVITIPLWSILGVFVILEIESIAHTSPQMVLSSHSVVYTSLPKAFEFAFFFILLLKRVMWRLAREKYEGILALHILLSQTMDPRRKMSYNQIKMCMCVEHL